MVHNVMLKQRVVILGDSHTHAFKQAVTNKVFPSDITVEVLRMSKIKDEKMFGDISLQKAMELVASLKKSDTVISALGGNQHNSLGLIQHPEKFDFFDSSSSEFDSEADVCVPYSLLRDVFERGLRGNDVARLKSIKQVAKCKVYHLGAPPPKQDEAHILNRPETSFTTDGILERGVSPAPLRLKLWSLQMSVTETLCDEVGVKFVPVPNEAKSADGFLAKNFYAKDATHANASYGELLLDMFMNKAFEN